MPPHGIPGNDMPPHGIPRYGIPDVGMLNHGIPDDGMPSIPWHDVCFLMSYSTMPWHSES